MMEDDSNYEKWRYFLSSVKSQFRSPSRPLKITEFKGEIKCFSTMLASQLLAGSGGTSKVSGSSNVIKNYEHLNVEDIIPSKGNIPDIKRKLLPAGGFANKKNLKRKLFDTIDTKLPIPPAIETNKRLKLVTSSLESSNKITDVLRRNKVSYYTERSQKPRAITSKQADPMRDNIKYKGKIETSHSGGEEESGGNMSSDNKSQQSEDENNDSDVSEEIKIEKNHIKVNAYRRNMSSENKCQQSEDDNNYNGVYKEIISVKKNIKVNANKSIRKNASISESDDDSDYEDDKKDKVRSGRSDTTSYDDDSEYEGHKNDKSRGNRSDSSFDKDNSEYEGSKNGKSRSEERYCSSPEDDSEYEGNENGESRSEGSDSSSHDNESENEGNEKGRSRIEGSNCSSNDDKSEYEGNKYGKSWSEGSHSSSHNDESEYESNQNGESPSEGSESPSHDDGSVCEVNKSGTSLRERSGGSSHDDSNSSSQEETCESTTDESNERRTSKKQLDLQQEKTGKIKQIKASISKPIKKSEHNENDSFGSEKIALADIGDKHNPSWKTTEPTTESEESEDRDSSQDELYEVVTKEKASSNINQLSNDKPRVNIVMQNKDIAEIKDNIDIERDRERRSMLPCNPNKRDIDQPCSIWDVTYIARYCNFRDCVTELHLRRTHFSPRIEEKFRVIKRDIASRLKTVQYFKPIKQQNTEESMMKNLYAITSIETGTRVILDALLFPLCDSFCFHIETNRNINCTFLPNCRFDYCVLDGDNIIGCVEAKSSGGFTSASVAQAIVQLCILQTQTIASKKFSGDISNFPITGIISDGYRFIYIILEGSKLKFEHEGDKIKVREVTKIDDYKDIVTQISLLWNKTM